MKDGWRLYWGDLHGHSVLSDGRYVRGGTVGTFDRERNTPGEYFRFARDEAALDFAALTDHVYSLDPEKFRAVQEAADTWNEPGRFVAVAGYEWDRTHDEAAPGHSDHTPAYFPSGQGVLVPRGRDQKDVSHFCEEVAEAGGVAHAAHPSYWAVTHWGMNYGAVRANAAMMFTELTTKNNRYVQKRYCCEYPGCDSWHPRAEAGHSVQEALVRGLRLGFLGESDSHDGMPGTGPLAAVWAESLTDHAILEALSQRRVYATSGARILIETFAIHGHIMGEEIPTPRGPLAFRVRIEGTSGIERVELVHGFEGAAVPLATAKVLKPGSSHVDAEIPIEPEHARGFYYLRIIQTDGHRAWSSPIWLADR